MMLHDENGGIYCTAYGPCELDFNGVSITENTLYPFRNDISFDIKTKKSFSLYLKAPTWNKGYTVRVNGTERSAFVNDDGYIPVDIEKDCTVEITFNAEIEVIRVDDSDASAKYPIAIKYGALLFSYHVPEKWESYAGTPHTPLPEGWSWFNVTPNFKEADVADIHERTGLRKYQTSWNIAMDEKISPDDITVELCDTDGYAWEVPLIKLHTHCYKAPYMCAPYPHRTFEPFEKKQFVTDKLDITLVPYGCTNLRITYFPIADI